eukprot:4456236-Alexandrium_andersonii.AAC.1
MCIRDRGCNNAVGQPTGAVACPLYSGPGIGAGSGEPGKPDVHGSPALARRLEREKDCPVQAPPGQPVVAPSVVA